MTKYAVHPGFVTSRTDGDEHYMGALELVRLYQLKQGEYVVVNRDKWGELTIASRALNTEGMHNLYPRYDGHYGRPDEPHDYTHGEGYEVTENDPCNR